MSMISENQTGSLDADLDLYKPWNEYTERWKFFLAYKTTIYPVSKCQIGGITKIDIFVIYPLHEQDQPQKKHFF